MKSRLLVCALSAAATLAAVPSVARAANPPPAAVEDARQHYKRGIDLYGEQNYAAALIEFRRAYEIAPSFAVLYNIGQIHYQLHEYAPALRYFQQYMKEGGSRVPANRRAEVEKAIGYLRDRVGYVELVTAGDGLDVTIDGVPSGRTPLAQPIIVTVGRRRIELVRNDHTVVSRQIDVAAGDRLRVEMNEPVAAAPAATASPPPAASAPAPAPAEAPAAATASTDAQPATSDAGAAGDRGPWPTIMWTTAGTLGAATVVTGVLALKASKDLSTKRDTAGVTTADLDSAQSKTKTLALVTDVLGGLTVLAVGTATYLTVTSPSRQARLPVEVHVGVGSVSLSGTF